MHKDEETNETIPTKYHPFINSLQYDLLMMLVHIFLSLLLAKVRC